MSPQDAFQREMEIVKKSKDSVDERRAKDQAAAKVPYFIRKALGDVFHEISHADLVYACKTLMDIDEEDGKSWHARTSKKETRARIKRACKFLRAYYKNKALEDKDETCKATIAARDEELATIKDQAFQDALEVCAFWYALRDAGRFAFRRDPSCAAWAYVRSKYQVVEGGLFSLVHCPADVKIVDKLMLRLANQLVEDAEEMVEALIQYNTKMEGVLDLCDTCMPELEDSMSEYVMRADAASKAERAATYAYYAASAAACKAVLTTGKAENVWLKEQIKAKDDELKATDDQLKAKYKAIAKVKRAKAKRASKGKPFACVN